MPKFTFLSAVRIVLGALFLWSGTLKLLDPWQNFQAVIETYRIVEGDPARWAARVIPWIEAIAGLYLAAGLYTRAAAGALWAMNSVFLAALAQALVRRLPLRECGCFGDSFSMPPAAMLGVDAVLWFGFGSLLLWADEALGLSLDARYRRSSPVTRRKK